MTDAARVESVLEERPDLEPALESALAVDDDHDVWTFDDLPVDSGPFGELVSRGLVESDGDGYRLADPEAVRTALRGESTQTTPETESAFERPSVPLPAFDRTTAALVGGALLLVALVRSYPIGAVYRNGDVVLSGNDPYYYRYWVEQAMAGSATPFDFGALETLPDAVTAGEPLMVATLWWLAELLGSGATVVGHVLAWYPVVSAVVTAGLVYLLSVRVAGDRRVGLAAVVVLAILPGHALRTSIGYADHHAFDYPWLAATALVLVVLATVDRDRLTSAATGLASLGLGALVAAQVLAWEAGPLLIAPIGLVVTARALLDVRADRSPAVAGLPVAAGLAVAAVLTWLVHESVGWHTTVVASSPALLFVGVGGVLALATAVHRTTGDARHLVAVDAVAAVGGVLLVWLAMPDAWATLVDRLGFLFGTHEAVETESLLSLASFDFLFLFGLTLVLALPMMAVALGRAVGDGRWLVATVYAWYFFALASIQVRFVGELGAFAALFAGLGFVQLSAWVDLVDPVEALTGAREAAARPVEALRPLRVPDRRTVGALLALFVLFGALGAIQTGIKTNQVVTEDATYEVATEIREVAAERDRTYPDDYVLSRWGYNRVYNYFVSGEAANYGYAERTYADFISAEDPAGWYERLRDRVGYVVLENQDSPPESVHARLFDAYGSRQGDVAGLGHYRAVVAHESGDRTALALVPGATLTGTAPANATVSVSTSASIPGASFTYERRTAANASGEYAVRVAYPGEYEVVADGEATTVSVADRAVRNGTEVGV